MKKPILKNTTKELACIFRPLVSIFLLLFSITIQSTFAAPPANDDCAGATIITPGTNSVCTATTADVMDATLSMSGCTGTADDDVWFSFVANATNQIIKVTPSESFNPVIQLFDGTCGALTNIKCADETKTGVVEKLPWTGLTMGNTYYVRVYHFGAAKPATTTFDICIYAPAVPVNDECANAISVPVNTTAINQTYETEGATNSGIPEACLGTVDPNDDVWFKFVAPASQKVIIRVDASNDFRPVVEVYDGCGGTSISCKSGLNHNVIIKTELSGLTAGNTYYFRVFDYFSTLPKTSWFVMSIMDPPAPTNDDCANALTISNTGTQDYMSQTLNGASASAGHPAVCAGNADDDMWYKFVASSSKQVVKMLPSSGFDAVFQVLDGCGAAANVMECSDDSTTGDEEFARITGLTSGNTYYVRAFSKATGVTSTTSFDIATYTVPDHDDCAEARDIIVSPTGNVVNDSTTGASLSMTSCSVLGDADDDVWYKFVASASDNTITVEPSTGFDPIIQLLDGCSGTSMECKNDSAAGQMEELTPTTLVPGNTYYVRVYDMGTGESSTSSFDIYARGNVIQSVKDEINNSLKLYPVPVNGLMSIEFNLSSIADVSLRILNSEGRMVYNSYLGRVNGTIEQQINTEKMEKGIYLVQIVADGKTTGKKIIIY